MTNTATQIAEADRKHNDLLVEVQRLKDEGNAKAKAEIRAYKISNAPGAIFITAVCLLSLYGYFSQPFVSAFFKEIAQTIFVGTLAFCQSIPGIIILILISQFSLLFVFTNQYKNFLKQTHKTIFVCLKFLKLSK
jgi:hypothetical protein